MDAGELDAFLHSPVAMLGASVGPGLVPEAFRVWGARMEEPRRLRVLIPSDGGATLENLRTHNRIAVTVTDITTFTSVQVKGRVVGGIDPLGPAEIELMLEYDQRFAAALVQVGFPPNWERCLRPGALLSVALEVEELFDQSPGARAGHAMPATSA
ncbi:MAG: hypothetical protein JWL73_1530 [Actinomycetia bacterium]|nr:hypothetical protein [Actinomycetes bacterium]